MTLEEAKMKDSPEKERDRSRGRENKKIGRKKQKILQRKGDKRLRDKEEEEVKEEI
jgi:hypothetical protein